MTQAADRPVQQVSLKVTSIPEAMDIGMATVERWIDTGELPFWRMTDRGPRYVDVRDLHELMDRKKERANADLR